jgi:5-oxoprolinase (ATP-hydrolysing)
LAVTDANVLVGKVQPDFFPAVFGPEGHQRLDANAVAAKFSALSLQMNRSPESIADGFLRIAVQ